MHRASYLKIEPGAKDTLELSTHACSRGGRLGEAAKQYRKTNQL